ncbi:hypothetical protein [Amycolatopsis sp. cmx-4-61]|uniref:hypothetical protein n=1 Tax=Amycolatopsis sp. cmx-4-61 TaxID=2790937 RepID=UPI00397DA7BF
MTEPHGLVITEHAKLMSGGSMNVFPDDPETEADYPMDKRIRAHQRFGGKVYWRRIIVVDDWEEVPRA